MIYMSSIKYSEVYYFADEANPRNLTNWLKIIEISLNVDKAQLKLFTSPKKQLDCDFKSK